MSCPLPSSREEPSYTVVFDDQSPDNPAPCVKLELTAAVAQDAASLLAFFKSLEQDFPQHQRIEVRCPSLEQWPSQCYDFDTLDEMLENADIKKCDVVNNTLIIKRPSQPHEGPNKAFEVDIQEHFNNALPGTASEFLIPLRNTGIFSVFSSAITVHSSLTCLFQRHLQFKW